MKQKCSVPTFMQRSPLLILGKILIVWPKSLGYPSIGLIWQSKVIEQDTIWWLQYMGAQSKSAAGLGG